MQKLSLILIAALVPLLSNAALIDLGPPDKHIIGERSTPWDSGITSLDGQTFSFDLTFSGGEFIRIFDTTSKVFFIGALLQLHGTGLIQDPIGSGWTLDGKGQQNSRTWNLGGGSTLAQDETFSYMLGYAFPMLADVNGTPRTDTQALDIYGLHLAFTLPDTDQFNVVSASLLIAPGGSNQWRNTWAIGPNVPDSGGTLFLMAIALLGAATFKFVFLSPEH